MSRYESVSVKCIILDDSKEKAVRVLQSRGKNRSATECWLPRSQLDHISKHRDMNKNIQATIDMPLWLAEEKGLDF